MKLLVLGLVLFLGLHSTRIVAEGWRGRMLARHGERAWKGAYSLLSLLGLALIVWGYGAARHDALPLWDPPRAMRHLAGLLTLAAFVLVAAAYVPRNAIKARLHHPMVLGVKAWALGHLLANGTLADLLLFGGFLVWAVFDFRAARARDRAQRTTYPPGTPGGTVAAVAVGVAAWALFAFWGHAALVGVRPFG
jgi:uncharacterized membrane protein